MSSVCLVDIITFLYPYLTLDDVLRVTHCSLKLFREVQNCKTFWKHLDFSSVPLRSRGSVLVELAQSAFSKKGTLITSLHFPFCADLDDSILQQFTRVVAYQLEVEPPNRSHLLAINFDACRGVTNMGLLHLVPYCDMLEQLSLYCNVNITDRGLIPLIKSCRKTLVKLCLSGCRHVGDGFINVLASAPSTSLRHLDLTRTVEISDFGLHMICNGLLKLETLILYACNHLSYRAFKHLMNLKYLTCLDLCGCNIGDADIKTLFMSCPFLKHLNLTWCTRLSDDAIVYISQTWSETDGDQNILPTGLVSLSLHGLKAITPKGFQALISSRHRLTLQALDIRGCVDLAPQYLSEDYRGLKEAFPNLKKFYLHS